MKRNLTLIALMGLTAAIVLYPKLSPQTPGKASSIAAEPPPADPARPIVAAGRVEPASEEVKLGAEMDGKLKAVLVEEGSLVRKGQVVAVLENGDYLARVELAKATLAEREAALQRLLNGARQEERREARAAIREAEAMLENARTERSRRAQLLERGAISRTEFDLTDREYRVMQARVEAASERFAFVDAAARSDERMRAEAEVAQAKARVQEAEALLEKTYIRSPLNGVVLHRYLKTGESVSTNANTPVVSLGDTSRLRVRVDVDETDVARLALGQHAWATADAYGKRKFTGRVVQIGQKLGRKNVRTDEPTERVDTKILETLVELDPGQTLPVGLRVDAFIETR
jgi:HlyD family secretion protein